MYDFLSCGHNVDGDDDDDDDDGDSDDGDNVTPEFLSRTAKYVRKYAGIEYPMLATSAVGAFFGHGHNRPRSH